MNMRAGQEIFVCRGGGNDLISRMSLAGGWRKIKEPLFIII